MNKRMYKFLLTITIISLTTLTLVACGKDSDKTNKNKKTDKEVVQETTTVTTTIPTTTTITTTTVPTTVPATTVPTTTTTVPTTTKKVVQTVKPTQPTTVATTKAQVQYRQDCIDKLPAGATIGEVSDSGVIGTCFVNGVKYTVVYGSDGKVWGYEIYGSDAYWDLYDRAHGYNY